jgi:hypothetical protein
MITDIRLQDDAAKTVAAHKDSVGGEAVLTKNALLLKTAN